MKQVTAAIDPAGRLIPHTVTIRYRGAGARADEVLTKGIGNGYSWPGHVDLIERRGGTVIEVLGHRGKRTWRLRRG